MSQSQNMIQNKIVVYNRKGAYKNFYYQSIKLNMTHIKPIGDQLNIVENLTYVYFSRIDNLLWVNFHYFAFYIYI